MNQWTITIHAPLLTFTIPEGGGPLGCGTFLSGERLVERICMPVPDFGHFTSGKRSFAVGPQIQ